MSHQLVCRALALVALLTPIAGRAQPAGGWPVRTFDSDGRIFASSATPKITWRLPEDFRHLGSIRFPLKEVAWVERQLFARMDNGRIERLMMLQFEGYMDGVDGSYSFGIPGDEGLAGSNYRFSPQRVRLGPFDFVHNTWAFDHGANVRENPEAEGDHTVRFLEERDWRLPDELIMSRFVTEIGDDARNELILFYLVPLAELGRSLEEFPDGGAPTVAFDELSELVFRESVAAFEGLVR